VLGGFHCLIGDFISLFFRFISLFGDIGICPQKVRNINDLPVRDGSLDGARSGFSQYLPTDQGLLDDGSGPDD
jgi:hypothetical protein